MIRQRAPNNGVRQAKEFPWPPWRLDLAAQKRFRAEFVLPLSAVRRFITLCALLAATAAMASQIGDAYAKVIADNGQPKSQMEAGSIRVLIYPDVTIKTRDDVVIAITASPKAQEPQPQSAAPSSHSRKDMPVPEQIAELKMTIKKAVDRVTAIVNQPVATIPLTPNLGAGVWTGGWFHPGAIRPDFNTVDVRATQETAEYSKFPYITSNLNPDIAFKGDEVEFNPMTKFFSQARTLPKKRLTEDEMLEINRLYRIIGECSARIAALSKQ
jgi:hypothetical protein